MVALAYPNGDDPWPCYGTFRPRTYVVLGCGHGVGNVGVELVSYPEPRPYY